MENSEEFKRMVTSINQLAQQLLSIQEDAMVNEKYGVEAEEEIESYFARCEQALAAKKVTLLRELAEQIKSQSMLLLFLYPLFSTLFLLPYLLLSCTLYLLSAFLLSSAQSLRFINFVLQRKQRLMHKRRSTRRSRQGRRY